MASRFERSSKRQRTQSPKSLECVICGSPASEKSLNKPKDMASWMKLLYAAELRDHGTILQYVDHDGIPDISYHKNCKAKFTHKKTLSKLKKQVQSTKKYAASFRATCVFCGYGTQTGMQELLGEVVNLTADDTLRKAAIEKHDTDMVAITSTKLVAVEAHYHRTCYLEYIRPTITTKSAEEAEQWSYATVELKAYNMLFNFIRTDLFERPRIETMICITEKLTSYMKQLGFEEFRTSTKKRICSKLEEEFGNSICITSNDKGELIIVPNSLSRETLIKENLKLTSELESRKLENRDKVLIWCALNLRAAITNSDTDQPWPPEPDNLDNDYIPLPYAVRYFLRVLLTGDIKNTPTSPKVERLIQSLGQDYIYIVSAGKQKPAKHILLPWTIKSLTGNVKLIKIISRLGHGISYSQLKDIDNALCLQKLADEDKCIVPPNIHPYIPTCLAFDNIDRVEEKGALIAHRVNGIVIQPRVPTVIQQQPIQELQKRKTPSAPPLELPPYNAGVREGPPILIPSDVDYDEVEHSAQVKNRAWSFIRQSDVQHQSVASWTGFNMEIRNSVGVTKDVIAYLPTINAPATELSTAHEILNQVLEIMEKLQLQEISCVFDQALYAKAAEVAWKDAEKFRPIVLRMGVFHTICNMLSIIGKRFQDAGLRDLAVESGVIAGGYVSSVLDGREYNRAVRLHKIIYEALLRLAWKGFYIWIEEKHLADLVKFNDAIVQSKDIRDHINQENFNIFLSHPSNIRVFELFHQYMNILRAENGDLSSFWMSYVDMVEIVLGLIRGSREGNWPLHLAMIRKMIPWTFAYDKQNYARYLSVYYGQMTRLEEHYPRVYEHLRSGGFSVQIDSTNPFGRIPVDQTIEETVNRDTQTGFILKSGSCFLTTEYGSTCVRQMREMVEMHSSNTSYTELEPSRISRDERDVQSVLNIFIFSWINPFGDSRDLVCLSTGSAAPSEIREDLLHANVVGERAYQEFRANRLEASRKKFYDRLPKQNLKTFSSIQKCKSTRTTNKEIVLKADYRLFAHIVLIASSRSLDMRKVLKHPLGPLPWALANCDGTMKKTNKAALARNLEKRIQPASTIPSPSACVIDGMALVHRVNAEKKMYAELASIIFNSALTEGTGSDRIDLVFDVYNHVSIKRAERDRRNTHSTLVSLGEIAPGQRIKHWRSILASSDAKSAIIRFLFKEWQQVKYMEKIGNKVMFLTCDAYCVKLDRETISIIPQLQSSQEEADTRLLLHAKHASPDHEAIIVVSEDTDVFVLSLAFHQQISKIFIKCGTHARTRYVNIADLGTLLGKELCEGLLALHAYTGCDTVSAFAGRGKMAAFNLIAKDEKLRQGMIEFGKHWHVSDELFATLQRFTCRMYATNTTITEVNELRYQLFRTKKGGIESSLLPPCEDCLRLHALRANYQSAIWRRSLEANPYVPPPESHGWTMEDGQLSIEWMRVLPAPETVLELLSCKCKKSCTMPNCECLANGLKCTSACKLEMCENFVDDLNDGFDEEDDEDDEHGAGEY